MTIQAIQDEISEEQSRQIEGLSHAHASSAELR